MNDIISINRQFLNMAREASKSKSGEILTGLSRPMLDWIGKMSLEQIESLSKDIGVSAINLRLSETEMDRLLALGAAQLEPVTEVGEGIKVAAVRDPFGNRFGLIENPHFKAAEVR